MSEDDQIQAYNAEPIVVSYEPEVEIDYDALGSFVEDEMTQEDLAALFAAALKVDALERGANGWKFSEPERTILGKVQSAARLAGL